MRWFTILFAILSWHLFFPQVITGNNHADTLSISLNKISVAKGSFKNFHWKNGVIVPSALILAGVAILIPDAHCSISNYSIQNKVQKIFRGYSSPIDNYLQFAPLTAVYGLKATGIKSRNSFINQFALSLKSELLMTLIVQGMKSTIVSRRPAGGMNSMPSGHTAQAFVSATILDLEYRDTSPWISIAGYATATTTAMYRMINNKHWISDVLVGAGIGIFTTKLVYYTHHYHIGPKINAVIVPTPLFHGAGITFAMAF
jgi:membrane-associated phospholipid phosphatase